MTCMNGRTYTNRYEEEANVKSLRKGMPQASSLSICPSASVPLGKGLLTFPMHNATFGATGMSGQHASDMDTEYAIPVLVRLADSEIDKVRCRQALPCLSVDFEPSGRGSNHSRKTICAYSRHRVLYKPRRTYISDECKGHSISGRYDVLPRRMSWTLGSDGHYCKASSACPVLRSVVHAQ